MKLAVQTDATESAQPVEILSKQNAQLRMLTDAIAYLLSTDNPDAMVSDLFAKVSKHLSLDAYFNYMVNDAGNALVLDSYAGITPEVAADIKYLDFGQAMCGTVAQRKHIMVAENIQSSDDARLDLVRGLGIRAYACYPLMSGDRLLGTLSFSARNRNRFTDDELEFFRTISQYVALAKNKEETIATARRQADELQRANKRKDEFLAHMSHEMRTPMNVIMGIANILTLKESVPPRQKELLSTLCLSSSALMTLINDMLDVARIESNTIGLNITAFEPATVAEEVFSMLGLQAREKNLTLIYESQGLDGRVFLGDESRIRQVAVNLVGNAIKFTHSGNVQLSIIAGEAVTNQKTDLTISVKDTGIGIAPDKFDSIFEKFHQADLSITRNYGGCGLGLAISKNLAEIMGGVITVKSQQGKGSEFIFKLALEEVGEQTMGAAVKIEHKVDTAESDTRILLVEDNEGNQLVAKTILEEMGYTIDIAMNGMEALKQYSKARYDVVLMDVQMPVLDGFAATRAIRETEREQQLSRTPIIGLTAHAISGYHQKCLNEGMDDYLSKPFRIEELQNKVHTALGKRPAN